MIYAAVVTAVLDGDTFNAKVEVWPNVQVTTAIRLAGVDAPELKGQCAAERTAAKAAQRRLAELLVGQIHLSRVKPDKYAGRVDAVVTVDGKAIGEILVAEGHARVYTGGARGGWC